MESEFKEAVEEEIERAYRMALPVQLFLMVISSVVSIYILSVVNIQTNPLQVKTSIFLVVLALLWPYFIQVDNRLTDIIEYALFGGALFSMITLILLFINVQKPRNALLVIPFVEIVGMELLHHTTERLRKRKSIGVYVMDFILTGVFFASIFLFFWDGVFKGSLPWVSSSLIAFVLSTLYFYAVLPEREF